MIVLRCFKHRRFACLGFSNHLEKDMGEVGSDQAEKWKGMAVIVSYWIYYGFLCSGTSVSCSVSMSMLSMFSKYLKPETCHLFLSLTPRWDWPLFACHFYCLSLFFALIEQILSLISLTLSLLYSACVFVTFDSILVILIYLDSFGSIWFDLPGKSMQGTGYSWDGALGNLDR